MTAVEDADQILREARAEARRIVESATALGRRIVAEAEKQATEIVARARRVDELERIDVTDEIGQLRDEISRLRKSEAHFRRRAGAAESARLQEARAAGPRQAGHRRQRPAEGGSINGVGAINDLGFEQLRLLGLSVSRASRFLEVRDRIGGFAGPGDLDRVPGLTSKDRSRLKSLPTGSRVSS